MLFDPFTDADPPVLVHELDGREFEAAWGRLAAGDEDVACPVCGQRGVAQRGTSPYTSRPWIRFVCGDVVGQENTAG